MIEPLWIAHFCELFTSLCMLPKFIPQNYTPIFAALSVTMLLRETLTVPAWNLTRLRIAGVLGTARKGVRRTGTKAREDLRTKKMLYRLSGRWVLIFMCMKGTTVVALDGGVQVGHLNCYNMITVWLLPDNIYPRGGGETGRSTTMNIIP